MALDDVHTGRSGQKDHWHTLTELFQVAGWKLHHCMIDCQEVPPSFARVQPYTNVEPAHLDFAYTDASYTVPTSLNRVFRPQTSSLEEVPWSRRWSTKTEYQITVTKAVQMHRALY